MKTTHKSSLLTLPPILLTENVFNRLTDHELGQLNATSRRARLKTRHALGGRRLATLIDHETDAATDTLPDNFLILLKHLPKSHQSWIPYLLINAAFKHHHEAFANTVLNSRIRDDTPKEISTSCINTALICYAIFTGQKTIKEVLEFIYNDTEVTLRLKDKWENPVVLTTLGLFDMISVSTCHNPDKDELIDWEAFSKAHLDFERKLKFYLQLRLYAEHSPKKARNNLAQYFIDFNHNHATFKRLTEAISHHKATTSPDQSYFYFMISANQDTFSHVWIIEQFYSSERDAVRYRRYQSWIKETILLKDMDKVHNTHPNRSWSEKKCHRFFDKVENLLTTHHNKLVSPKQCFGHGSRKTPDHRATNFIINDVLFTQTFGFFCKAVRPTDCIDRYETIARQSRVGASKRTHQSI